MELTSTQLTDGANEVICSCRPVQTLTAGPTCKLLTKNAIFQSPEDDGSILVCAGDEASNSAMVLLPFSDERRELFLSVEALGGEGWGGTF